MTKNIIVLIFAISFIFLCSGYSLAEKDTLLIGLLPEENVFRYVERHKPLESYLSEKLGIKVKFTILQRYADIIDMFTKREMDGAFFGVFTSVLAKKKLGVQPLARQVNIDGSTTSKGYIFARKDSGITTLKDMKDKRIAFVDKATATGYVFAIAFLRENGITDIDKFFSGLDFTGSHDSTVYAVLDKRADIGVVKSRIFDRLSAKDPLIKEETFIIAKSTDLPDMTLCLRKDIAPEIKEKIENTLLNMHEDPKGREVLKKLGAIRFILATEADFKPVINLIKKAGINLESYKYR
ncbi:MAG: phosphate/phosphite/phosphonate ABC transporter substrate-binding protein [Nitrospirae bacterium]|nr:phosphate/phosphite/phosphonate ABC transporter substrate-binding protein [Nitrospirota bacterium]